MRVIYDDVRRTAFLSLVEDRYRGDVGNLFAAQIRAGEEDPALICRMVWLKVGEREAAYVGDLGPGTIPAATLRGIMRANTQTALAYVDWLKEWERLTPSEKAALKAPASAAYRARWMRGGNVGGAR